MFVFQLDYYSMFQSQQQSEHEQFRSFGIDLQTPAWKRVQQNRRSHRAPRGGNCRTEVQLSPARQAAHIGGRLLRSRYSLHLACVVCNAETCEGESYSAGRLRKLSTRTRVGRTGGDDKRGQRRYKRTTMPTAIGARIAIDILTRPIYWRNGRR